MNKDSLKPVKMNKASILASLLWKFLERGGAQIIQFVVQLILARLLTPEDYGIVALVVVFTSIATVIVQSGLNTALIQKKNIDDTDLSSAFYLTLIFASFIYSILFLFAPLVSSFYQIPQITLLLRVLSINVVFGAINSIQEAIVARNLLFKKLFFRSMIALLTSGAIGIFIAYSGGGAWALVAQTVCYQFTLTTVLWFTLRWRPKLLFSLTRIKSLLSFSWKILLASLLSSAYREFRNLLIGKYYNPTVLGFYTRGQQFPSLIVSNIDGSIQAVLFPVLAAQQDDRSKVKAMMRRAIVTSSFIVFPMMVGLAVIAEPLTLLLLTSKWLPAVPFIQIFCAYYIFYPIHSANLQAINGLGYSGTFLRLNILRRITGIAILAVTIFWSPQAVAWGYVANGFIAFFINATPNKKLVGYSYREQVGDILPSLVLSFFMGAAMLTFRLLELPALQTLVIQTLSGIILYLLAAWLLKMECFEYLCASLKEFFKQKA